MNNNCEFSASMTSKLEQEIYEYWQRQPCGVWHSNNSTVSREYFLDVTNHRLRTVDANNQQTNFVKFDSWHNKRVLEIGCGIGTDGARFAEAGADYVGIDITDNAIELARQRFALFGLPGRFEIQNGADSAAYNNLGKFDLVYCWGVMHHWPDLTGFISNIFNSLNPGGQFIFLVYAKHSWQYAMVKAGLAQYEAQSGCPLVNVYTEEEIQQFLDSKFQIEEIVQVGTFMYNLEKYKNRELQLEPWFEAMP